MSGEEDYDELQAALGRAGSTWDAAQAHGLITAALTVRGADAVPQLIDRLFEGGDPRDALRREGALKVAAVAQATHHALAERLSGFDLLLPGEEESDGARVVALAAWCEGFLHGLVSTAGPADAEVRERLARDPSADIIRDMLQITRATADDDVLSEGDEEAYAELVEYLRVAAQLVYEELAGLRPAGPA